MQLQSDCNLTEGKAFGGRRTFASEKATMMSTLVRLVGSLKGNLDKKLIRDSVTGYKDLKEEFHGALFGIFKAYTDGDIGIDDMEKQWRTTIKDAWERAYGFGVGSVGNPYGAKTLWDEDRSWLKGAEGEEFGYLSKFIKDIRNDTLIMDPEKRLEMYAQTLDGVYHHGQVEGSPDYVRIWWILREAKHCPDCIRLAAGSPYTKKGGKNPLPGVPRNGLSRCLSNCMCFLHLDYEGQEPERAMGIVGPAPFKVPEGYELPTFKEYDELSQMSTEIDRLRGLIKASTGDQKTEYIQARRELNKDLIAYTEKKKIYYVPGSNYTKSSKPPSDIAAAKELKARVTKPPEGYRGPTKREKEWIDKMVKEIGVVRIAIRGATGIEAKELIAKRYGLSQEMIDYIEKRKIYYLPATEFGIEMVAGLGIEDFMS